MDYIGDGKNIIAELEDHRIVNLDLDSADDWGDIRVSKHIEGDITTELGNDCDGWFKIVRVFEEYENDGNPDFIDEKFRPYIEVEMDDFIEMILVREIAYCEGLTIAEHKELMEEYGYVYENLYIPEEWKECAPDYKKGE